MSDAERGQLTLDSAEVYETFFVPALFAQWAPVVCDAALLDEGQRVVDVACGTGVASRVAAERVGPTGHVVGVDLNRGMLGVARDRAPGVDWREAAAERLPLDDDSVDAAISQFGLMFFEDRAAALRELRRVVRPGGRIAVAVWSSLERTPGWQELCALVGDVFGPEAAAAEAAPWARGGEPRKGDLHPPGGRGAAPQLGRPPPPPMAAQ
ncbi:MAG: methyltransferase domain-containing protein, partial [Actinomycetota bacterium]